jgi:O-methyltransferase domain
VVEHASVRFEEAGLLERVAIESGDFFESVPPGGDGYLLKGVLHDWDDAPATRIPQSCRSVMTADSTLLVIEAVLPPGNAPSYGRGLDLLMKILNDGRERNETEFAGLLEVAGFRLQRVIPTATPRLSIVGARVA